MGRSYNPGGGGVTPFEGQEILSAFICPALQGSVNDYFINNRGFVNASALYVSATTPINITGLVGATPNRDLLVFNIGASTVTLKNASGASAAANRFSFGADLALAQFQSAKLIGLPSSGWGAQGGTPVAGGGGVPTTAHLVTTDNETGSLPNSAILGVLAGGSPAGTAMGATAIVTGNIGGIAAQQAVPFTSVLYDTSAFWSGANPTRLTAPVTGLYHVCSSFNFTNGATERIYLTHVVNGGPGLNGYVAVLNTTAGGNQFPGLALSTDLHLTAGDFVEAQVSSASGTTLVTNTNDSFMSIHRIN